jgi:hypothetical protein
MAARNRLALCTKSVSTILYYYTPQFTLRVLFLSCDQSERMRAVGLVAAAVLALAVLLRLSTHAVVSFAVLVGAAVAYITFTNANKNAAAVAAPSPTEALIEAKLATAPGGLKPALSKALPAASAGKAAVKTHYRFLKENPPLMELVRRLRFVSTFDPARFRDWIVTMNKLQKTYMYILGGRYHAGSYKATFDDLRDNVLETMYGFVLVVPPSFKHIYGVAPDAVTEAAILDARAILDTMSHVLANHMRLDLGLPADGPDVPVPANRYAAPGRENIVP